MAVVVPGNSTFNWSPFRIAEGRFSCTNGEVGNDRKSCVFSLLLIRSVTLFSLLPTILNPPFRLGGVSWGTNPMSYMLMAIINSGEGRELKAFSFYCPIYTPEDRIPIQWRNRIYRLIPRWCIQVDVHHRISLAHRECDIVLRREILVEGFLYY